MFEICPQIFPLIVPPVPNPWCFGKSSRRTTSRKNWTGYLQPFPSYEAFSMRESLGMAKYDPQKRAPFRGVPGTQLIHGFQSTPEFTLKTGH